MLHVSAIYDTRETVLVVILAVWKSVSIHCIASGLGELASGIVNYTVLRCLGLACTESQGHHCHGHPAVL